MVVRMFDGVKQVTCGLEVEVQDEKRSVTEESDE
jgi:hypothetical protein